MISANSRYAASSVVTIDDPVLGYVQVIVPSQQQAYTFNYVSHMVSDTDRLDRLAYQYYSDPTQWWRIADGNPELIFFGNLTPGTIIRIPMT